LGSSDFFWLSTLIRRLFSAGEAVTWLKLKHTHATSRILMIMPGLVFDGTGMYIEFAD
jgi:uncharacterized membrane protein YciS (DUF1049 family)